MMSLRLKKQWDRLSPRSAFALSLVLSILAGGAAALLLSFVLYRTELPSKPFIYVAF